MTSTTPTFSQWLKQRRKGLGLTQKDLAQQAGCAEVTVRKIETGDLPPSAPLAAALAKAAGASEADLPGLVALARGADKDFTAKARLLRPQRPNNLTAQLTPLIGRERDITAVRKRLLSDGARLITLLGSPGVGKTRLAQAVAEDLLEHFEHGVFFVRLAPITDPTLVASAIAQALDLQLSGPNLPELQLRAYLEERHLLLVIDNFEQVVQAAPLVDDLLRRCPWLYVLVTSRQPLRVRGERQMPVLPLALPAKTPDSSQPTAAGVLRYSAVAMFAERAEATQPDFAVTDGNATAVAELCRRLDGLPLAIELIAARVKLFAPAELLGRLRGQWLLSADGLRDVSARQKTLRGAISWSYDLLSPAEQTLFGRLAVFAGGCTLEAAQMLCEDALSPTHVLDGIASLLDKNLLHRETGLHSQPRYVMLEIVREYGLERLGLNNQLADLQRRHAECFVQLIEYAEQTDPDPGFVLLAHLIDDDIHNVRTALAWAIENDIQVALLVTAALLNWLGQRGPYSEAGRLLGEVLGLPAAAAHTVPRAKALVQAALRKIRSDTSTEAQAYADEALAISRELRYAQGEADALVALGRIAHTGSYNQDAARYYLESALARYRELGDARGVVQALAILSETALGQGDFPRARALSEECLVVAQEAGFTYPWPLAILANLAWAEGDLDAARLLYEQQLAAARPRGHYGMLVYALTELGALATRQRDFAAAHAYLNEAFVFLKETGDANFELLSYVHLAALVQAEGNYEGAVQLYRASLGGVKHYPDDWGPCLLNLAALAEILGQHELAASLLGAIEPVDKTIQRLFPIEREDYNCLVDTARTHLGAERFEVAWTEGRELGFDRLAEEAVSILETVLHVQDQAIPGG